MTILVPQTFGVRIVVQNWKFVLAAGAKVRAAPKMGMSDQPPGVYAGSVSGTVKDSNGAPLQRTMRAYDRPSGELLATVASNPSTGAYQLSVPLGNEVDVMCLDDADGSLENDLVHRTFPV